MDCFGFLQKPRNDEKGVDCFGRCHRKDGSNDSNSRINQSKNLIFFRNRYIG